MGYISDLIQERMLTPAVSRLANHPAILDRLRTEFKTRSSATLRMTNSISPLEWPSTAKSDFEFQQVDKRLLRQLDQWISCQPEFGSSVQPIPLPPAGAPPAAKMPNAAQVQPLVTIHTTKTKTRDQPSHDS